MYKVIVRTKNYVKLIETGWEDCAIHLVKSGTTNSWLYFVEDAYSMEPFNEKSVSLNSEDELEKIFNISLKTE